MGVSFTCVIATFTEARAVSCPPPPWFWPPPLVPPPVVLLLRSLRSKLICTVPGGVSEVLRYATAPIALPTSASVALALKLTLRVPPALVTLPILTPSTSRLPPEISTPLPSPAVPESSIMLKTSEAAAAPLRRTVRLALFQLLPESSRSNTVTLPSPSSRTGVTCCSTVTGAPLSAVITGASLIGFTVVPSGMAAVDQVFVPPRTPEISLAALRVCTESARRTLRPPGVPL